ncbi:MAG: hypothetical protein ACK559_02825, partial [bacterium]
MLTDLQRGAEGHLVDAGRAGANPEHAGLRIEAQEGSADPIRGRARAGLVGERRKQREHGARAERERLGAVREAVLNLRFDRLPHAGRVAVEEREPQARRAPLAIAGGRERPIPLERVEQDERDARTRADDGEAASEQRGEGEGLAPVHLRRVRGRRGRERVEHDRALLG